jgi:iron complex transport system substrate-binding protein
VEGSKRVKLCLFIQQYIKTSAAFQRHHRQGLRLAVRTSAYHPPATCGPAALHCADTKIQIYVMNRLRVRRAQLRRSLSALEYLIVMISRIIQRWLKRLFVASCFCALGWPLVVNALQVTDDSGKKVSLDKPARRIVSLAPHLTELLFAAGAGDAVVGVVSHSDYPPEAAQRAQVGDAQNLDVESIVTLQPDLVVAWQSGNPTPQLEQLIRFGIPVFYSEPRHLEDIATSLERLGKLAGSDEPALAAAVTFRAESRRLFDRYAGAAPVRVFYEIWHQPLMTVGGKHLISQLIRLCGGRNIFADLAAPAAAVEREAVLMADPEVIIASGITQQRPPWLDQWLNWPQLHAVRHKHLYFVPPDLIQRHTPRVLEGARRVCDQLQQARVSGKQHP